MAALRWLLRLFVATIIATSLMAPATQTLAPSSTSFHPGPPPPPPAPNMTSAPPPAPIQEGVLTRDTGMDTLACPRFIVCGTDLGIPFLLPNGGVGYLFGDTFAVAGPNIPNLRSGTDHWRSPVMLRSNVMPVVGTPIEFDSAVALDGEGLAPEFMFNAHRDGYEISVLPNDGISLPNGDIVVSFMSIGEGMIKDNPHWRTNFASLAISHDGNTFERVPVQPGAAIWANDLDNIDPFQMWSMQLDGDYVYIITVRSGRQRGPMMLLRVPWDRMLDKSAYACWNGNDWGGDCQPILSESKYGEPSLRKLSDGTWVMSYVDFTYTHIATRTAPSPEGPWSEPKVQYTWKQLNALYGGFVHPYSTADNLIMMVSTWQAKFHNPDAEDDDELIRYDVNHLIGTT